MIGKWHDLAFLPNFVHLKTQRVQPYLDSRSSCCLLGVEELITIFFNKSIPINMNCQTVVVDFCSLGYFGTCNLLSKQDQSIDLFTVSSNLEQPECC